MRNNSLPYELQCFEQALVYSPRPEPSTALRQRVLGELRRELRHEARRGQWRVAVAVAATVLLELGVSLAAIKGTAAVLPLGMSSPSVQEVARRVQELSPDISPEESVRRATLIQIAATVGCRTALTDAVGVTAAPPVILSAAKNLSPTGGKILRSAQDDLRKEGA